MDSTSTEVVPYGEYTAFTPALPDFYWDVYSAEQRVKHICFEIDKLVNYADMLGVNLNITHDDVEELKKQFDEFQKAGLAEVYEEILQKWINENMPSIISDSIKMVFFGLTDDGYFCAYIPDTWEEITFDTGMVFGREDYGHLILRFDADGSGVIDNTYSSSASDIASIKYTLDEMNTVLTKHDKTLYTHLDKEV